MSHYLFILVGAVLVNNVVLVKILGLCPFMGVSKKLETAYGMGAATTFVLTMATGASYIIDHYLLIPFGLESLPLRIAKHSANAKLIADKLEKDPHVAWVNYPGLESSDQRERAEKYLPDGASGVISFGVKGGRAAAMKFLDSLELAAIVVHVADARTSALHPASTTHRQLDDAQLKACGIGPELVRLSVGIENPEDLWDDIEQALKKTEGAE